MRIRRVGGAAAGVLALLLVGVLPAGAQLPDDQPGAVGTVRVTGEDASALSRCLADAQDGVIGTQRAACHRVALGADGTLHLHVASFRADHRDQSFTGSGVTVNLLGDTTTHSNVHLTIDISGGIATAINNCINDAQDGVIQNQQNDCTQYASAGNLIILEDVTFNIYV